LLADSRGTRVRLPERERAAERQHFQTPPVSLYSFERAATLKAYLGNFRLLLRSFRERAARDRRRSFPVAAKSAREVSGAVIYGAVRQDIGAMRSAFYDSRDRRGAPFFGSSMRDAMRRPGKS